MYSDNDLTSLAGILLDLPNFFTAIILIIILAVKVRLKSKYTFLLILSTAIPFFLNGVLFPSDYMSDQFGYWFRVQEIRTGKLIDGSFAIDNNIDLIKNSIRYGVNHASYLLSIIPIPFHETLRSLGFANKLLYGVIILFLYSKKLLNKETLLFLLLYPSIVLYTGLSLRDPIIFALMATSLAFAITNKPILAFLLLAPLYTIKIQNFLIIFIFVFIYFFFKVYKNGMSSKKFLFTLLFLFSTYVISAPFVMPILNFYRQAMWVEDGKDIRDITNIDGIGQFILEGFTSGIYFLLKPFPWEAEGLLQLIQSFENIIIFIFMVWITQKCLKHDKNRALFWILFLLAASTIYGLVVANYGTAARYRFPFIATYVIFIVYDTFYSPYAKKPIESSRTYWKNKLFDHEKSTLPSQR